MHRADRPAGPFGEHANRAGPTAELPAGAKRGRPLARSRVMTPDTERSRWIALVVCCSAMFMTLLDVSVTNVALPSIGADTGAVPSQLQWIVSGYTLDFGLVPVLGGKLGDDHGRRLMFQ